MGAAPGGHSLLRSTYDASRAGPDGPAVVSDRDDVG